MSDTGFTLDNNLEPAVGDVVKIRVGYSAGKTAVLHSKNVTQDSWNLKIAGGDGVDVYSEHEFIRLFRPRAFDGPPKKPLREARKKSMLDGIEPGQHRIFGANKITIRGVLNRWLRKNPEQEWSWATEGRQTIVRRDK